MNVREDIHFKQFIRSRNIKKTTQDLYAILLGNYCDYFNKTPTDFIEEAEQEEEQRIRMKYRKIKEYLLEYNEMLEETDFSWHYRKKSIVYVRSFYREFEIELPHSIPIRRDEEILITTDNMLTKKEIKKAVDFVRVKYKAIILLMMSSGMGASEVINLTFKDFLRSLDLNENKMVDIDELEDLLQKRSEYDLIPTWKIRRYKTKMPYFTFSSPESTQAIINYLRDETYRNRYFDSVDDWLFRNCNRKIISQIKNGIMCQEFARINDKCGLGTQGRLRFFRSHQLRKFFASTLQKNGVQQIITDWLLGHKLNNVTDAYFKPDIKALKKEYLNVLPDLSLEKVNIREVHTNEYEEFIKERELMVKESKANKERLDEIKKEMEDYKTFKPLIKVFMEDEEIQKRVEKRLNEK